MNRSKRNGMTLRHGFTILEVVIAMGMLALIAVPAIGLATMAVGRNKANLVAGDASELKTRIDTALRAYAADGETVFTMNFSDAASPVTFLASKDLLYIEADGAVSSRNDGYYRVTARQPVGYAYSAAYDAHRIIVYEVVWPNSDASEQKKKLFFTSVFRK